MLPQALNSCHTNV